MKDDGLSDGEDDASTDALVEEMLQQGDTAVIYPEAPEDGPQRPGTPDTSIQDENGTYQGATPSERTADKDKGLSACRRALCLHLAANEP